MPGMEYQVEYSITGGGTVYRPYGAKLAAAKAAAARASEKHGVAHVVAFSGSTAVGHIAYVEGAVSETLGVVRFAEAAQ